MRTRRNISACVVVLLLVAGLNLVATGADSSPASQGTGLPAFSEQAVEAFRKAFPDAVLDEVIRPTGLEGGAADAAPLFWTINYRVKDRKGSARIAPDGVIIRTQATVEVKELPAAVANAVQEAAAGATLKEVQRHESLATMKCVAREKPGVSYAVIVEQEKKRFQVAVGADGTVQGTTPVGEAGTKGAVDETGERAAPAPAGQAKEVPVPPEAAKAVQAVREAYPQAVLTDVESTVYDDGTGHISVIWYEVEFLVSGREKTVLASPEGVFLEPLDRSVDIKDLPAAVVAAVGKQLPGGVITSATRHETGADLRFVALEASRVTYVGQIEKEGTESSVTFAPDGKSIEPFRPWGKGS